MGSEMCIRDSEYTHRSTNKPHVPPDAARRAGGAESVDGRAGRCRHRWCVTALCQRDSESPRRRGAGAKGNTTKSRLVGVVAGQERCIAWRRGTQARPVVRSPKQRANSARWNPRSVTRQQRRGHPRRPLWRTGRQRRVEVLKEEFPRARRSRGRTGWVPSGQARREEQGSQRQLEAVAIVGLAPGC